jgi:hypothetical protein
MDIGGVLSRAWQIIWKFKILWLFGILASCSGSSNPGGSTSSYQFSGRELTPRAQVFANQITNAPTWQLAVIIGVSILVFLLLIALLVFLGTMGRIGLIRGTQQAESNASQLTFGELFRGGLPYFWRVFWLDLLVGLLVALVIAAIVLFFVIGSVVTLGFLLVCLFPFICVLAIALVIIVWLIYVIIEQANNAIVLENLGILAGFQRGWEVVKTNFGMMVIMGLILILGVQGIIGFILGLPIFLIAIPAILGTISRSTQGLWAGLLVAGLCFIAYLPFLIVLNGILRAYVGTAWTLTYMRLTGKPIVAMEPVLEATN